MIMKALKRARPLQHRNILLVTEIHSLRVLLNKKTSKLSFGWEVEETPNTKSNFHKISHFKLKQLSSKLALEEEADLEAFI